MGKKKKQRKMYVPRASEGRPFVEPQYSAKARSFMMVVGGSYLRLVEGVKKVLLHNEHVLIDELERFYNGNHRLIIAFRHVAKEDAPVMMFSLSRRIQRLIRKRNRNKPKGERIIAHAQFLYGSDVLEWAGKAAAWLFPKIGCVPVQNRGANKNGLNILRKAMRDGKFPIALAPEAQVTYQMYRCSSIAAGVSSLATWGEESSKDVTIIPVSIGYRHTKEPEAFIRSVLARWEHQTGLRLEGRKEQPILALLQQATIQTVSMLEELFQISVLTNSESPIRERILAICDKALAQAESLAQLRTEGSLLDRVFRLRYRGVEDIHPQGFDPRNLPPLGRNLADFHAMEAHIYLRHSQLVDVLEYIDPSYIVAPCSAGRACEYVLNLLDVTNRLSGGNINTRYSPRGKLALVDVGVPVRISEVSSHNPKGNRRHKLQQITETVFEGLQKVSQEMEPRWESKFFET